MSPIEIARRCLQHSTAHPHFAVVPVQLTARRLLPARMSEGKLVLEIATPSEQARAEAGAGAETGREHSTLDTGSVDDGVDGAWSDAHAVLVLCLVARACGSSNEEVVEGVVSPLQFEGACGFGLEESVLTALELLIPAVVATTTPPASSEDDAGEATAAGTVREDGTVGGQEPGAGQHILNRILGQELRAMERGGIRHGHGYEF
eukprot:COSAG06_NODE_2966_length_6018_cov_42.713127_7_plen_205_part_00